MQMITVFLTIALLTAVPAAAKRNCCIKEKYVLITHIQKNFTDAGQYCALHGLRLAKVDSQYQHDRLNAAIAQVPRTPNLWLGFWLGASDLKTKAVFVWSSNGKPFKYSNWGPGEPSTIYGEERCMISQPPGVWNNVPCTDRHNFVCEYY